MKKLQTVSLEIDKAIERFYVALQAVFIGDTALTEKGWSHADDV
jgi:hypothetical protein